MGRVAWVRVRGLGLFVPSVSRGSLRPSVSVRRVTLVVRFDLCGVCVSVSISIASACQAGLVPEPGLLAHWVRS